MKQRECFSDYPRVSKSASLFLTLSAFAKMRIDYLSTLTRRGRSLTLSLDKFSSVRSRINGNPGEREFEASHLVHLLYYIKNLSRYTYVCARRCAFVWICGYAYARSRRETKRKRQTSKDTLVNNITFF
jgi:hypothetical protein